METTEKSSRRVTFSEESAAGLNIDNIDQRSEEQRVVTINNTTNSFVNSLSFSQRFRKYLTLSPLFDFMCKWPFTYYNILWIMTHIIMVLFAYGVSVFLLGELMLPRGRYFGLYWLVVFTYVLGWGIAYIPYINMPPVFGMLLAGIITRTTGLYNIHEQIGFHTTSKIRTVCMAIITIRAGLQLSTTALVKHPLFLLKLALIPCTVECLVIALYSKYALSYPWDWAFLAGSIIACMSPVVTVNCILSLADKGYGEDRDMATLFTTASSIDGVHMVSLFALCSAFVFSRANYKDIWWSYLPAGLRDLFLGLFFGFIAGLLFSFLPHKKMKYVDTYRTSCLIIGSLMCTLGANSIAVTGGGYLASVFMSFIASTGWKMMEKTDITTMSLRRIIHILWHISQPILVGIIGAEIDFSHWSSQRFSLHAICLFIGLVARSFLVVATTLKTPFSIRERIFIALSWLPKGTLQAALAPITLENAQLSKKPEEILLAMDVVQMSLLAIVILAPVSAIMMTITGPILLNRIDDLERDRQRRLSILRMISLQPVHDQSKQRLEQQRESSPQPRLNGQEHQENSSNVDVTNTAESQKHLETT